jgi:predicted DNA-binding antitoxin AbrB/MazE fold protein
MSLRTVATYSEGKLLPASPLPLADGEKVEIAISRSAPKPESEEEICRRIRAAKTLDEWIEIVNNLPPEEDDDYDLYKALDENRKGQRPLFPPEMKGISW